MKVTIEKANEWAKMSCSKWCKNHTIRELNRGLYLTLIEAAYMIPELGQNDVNTSTNKPWVNTYPWPFVHPDFANWEEEYDAKNCTLVLDRSGCIVKHDTSYIAWKIYELTGEWPHKTSKIIVHDLDWLKFLAKSGYRELDYEPEPDHKYVGIHPINEKQSIGLWYEATISNPKPEYEDENIIVTTYLQKEFKVLQINSEKVTWVKIK